MKDIKTIIKNANEYFSSPDFKEKKIDNKLLEKDRIRFTKQFKVNTIKSINIEQYAIGVKDNKNTFCYILEFKLGKLGSNRGACASKYGVWIDEKTQKPKKADKWGAKDPDAHIQNN